MIEKDLNKLLKENKNINFDFYGLNQRQPIWSDDFMNKIANSKMGLT